MDNYKIKPPVDPDNPTYYLDKDKMRDALREHRDACLKAEAEEKELPRVSNYLGECFVKIAQGLGKKHNFSRYPFIKDMEMDGVMTCLKNIRSYDPDMIMPSTGKLSSPLAYFTQTCFYAFLNRIKKEKEELNGKWLLLMQSDLEAYTVEGDDEFNLNLSEYIHSLGPQVTIAESKREKGKKAPKTIHSPLDDL